MRASIGGEYVSHIRLRTSVWERLDAVARERCPEKPAEERQRLLEAAVVAYLTSAEIEGRLL